MAAGCHHCHHWPSLAIKITPPSSGLASAVICFPMALRCRQQWSTVINPPPPHLCPCPYPRQKDSPTTYCAFPTPYALQMFLTRISYTDLSDRSRTDPYPATCRRLSTFNRMPAALPAPPHKSAHKAEHTTAEFTQQHQLQHRPFSHGPFPCHMPSSFQGPSHVLRFPYTLQTFLTRTSYTDLSDPSRTDPSPATSCPHMPSSFRPFSQTVFATYSFFKLSFTFMFFFRVKQYIFLSNYVKNYYISYHKWAWESILYESIIVYNFKDWLGCGQRCSWSSWSRWRVGLRSS